MPKRISFLLTIVCISNLLFSQTDLLLSGPMVGYCEMREVMLWVQTNGPAEVYISYAPVDQNDKTFRTAVYQTRSENAYTAHLLANQVQPGLSYQYQVFINGTAVKRPYPFRFATPPLWHFRTDPPDMKIALGSCAFINDEPYDRPNKYGDGYEIFESIQKESPDMMLWLGDNTYLREADWYSRTGIIHRYTHTRSIPEMQGLLASCAQYATWDDHDYGPNNSDWTWRNKELCQEAFELFWANPSYGLPGQGGITSTFEWGDAEFFILDNRYFRSPNNKQTGDRTILGEHQLNWLIGALISSIATFKFVCIGGQVVNSADVFENYANIAPEERQHILQSIAAEGVRNVIFLTGDRHHSELSLWEHNKIKVYDFTVSPLTSGSHNAIDEMNRLRIEGSHVGIRNYGTIEISGKRLERKLVYKLFDTSGKMLWSHEIEAQYR